MAARLEYKGHPLLRKDNMIYYGSFADKYIILMQVLETKKVKDLDVATRVSIQLQRTDPTLKSRDRIEKKSESIIMKPSEATFRRGAAFSAL